MTELAGPADQGVALLDAGEGRRLERFGPRVVDRPAPGALVWRRDLAAWRDVDLRFDPDDGWTGPRRPGSAVDAATLEPWLVQVDGLTMELRPTSSGGLGLYPEHAANLPWLAQSIERRRGAGTDGATTVLNLFAHTGLASLAAARSDAAVVHVDAARTAVAWARRNAERAGLADRPIRWLVDDAGAFVAREARRGRHYNGIVLDPPSFGHAGKRRWRLEDELPGLLGACASILGDGGFVLLTAHSEGLDGSRLEHMARAAFPATATITTAALALVAASGAQLELGWSARIDAG